MSNNSKQHLTFRRLTDISPDTIIAHMNTPRVGLHMPLLTSKWGSETVLNFVAMKEEYWRRDGLGHWAILCDNVYAGWGGFQKEGNEWDYGLVLKPSFFGLGLSISKKALEFAKADERIPFVTFLLPPSRKKLKAILRLGAKFVDQVEHQGAVFLKYQLHTE